MKRAIRLLGIIGVLSTVAACNLLPAQAQLPQVHDFGLPPDVDSNASALPLRIEPTTAPVWLADNAIHYRLLYSDPTVFKSYADNRWASSPAELLDTGLRYALPTGAGAGPGDSFVLETQLLQFEQVFSSSNESKVQLVLQATIRRASDGQIVSARRFQREERASADVRGAVFGLAQLGQRTEQEVVEWAKGQVTGLR